MFLRNETFCEALLIDECHVMLIGLSVAENLSMSKIVSADALKQMLSEEQEESYTHPARSASSPARGKENVASAKPMQLSFGQRELSPAKTMGQLQWAKSPQKTTITIQVCFV